MEITLCPYKYMFGEPSKGIHSYKIFDIAIMDVLLTIIFAFVISYFLKKNFKEVLLVLFLLGIISHRLFCIRTTVDKFLFP